MNLTLKVEASELVEAIHDLAGAMRTLSATGNCVSELIEQAVEVKTAAPAAPAAPIVPASVQKTQEEITYETAVEVADNAITLEALRAKLGDLSKNGKSAAVKALIAKYGATKLADLDKTKYSDVMSEAEAL